MTMMGNANVSMVMKEKIVRSPPLSIARTNALATVVIVWMVCVSVSSVSQELIVHLLLGVETETTVADKALVSVMKMTAAVSATATHRAQIAPKLLTAALTIVSAEEYACTMTHANAWPAMQE